VWVSSFAVAAMTMSVIETPSGSNGAVAEEWDPEAHNLFQIERVNKMQCAFLASLGHESSQLQMKAPCQSAIK